MELPISFVVEAILTDGKNRIQTKGHCLQLPGGGWLVIWGYGIFPGLNEKIPVLWSQYPAQFSNDLVHVFANQYRMPKLLPWENLADFMPPKIGEN